MSIQPKIKATTVALVGDNESLRKDIISAISNITRRTPIAINGKNFKTNETFHCSFTFCCWLLLQSEIHCKTMEFTNRPPHVEIVGQEWKNESTWAVWLVYCLHRASHLLKPQ